MEVSGQVNSRPRPMMALVMGLLSAGGSYAAVSPATTPPGGLAPSNTPQIVLLTFDDSVTSNSYRLVQGVLTNHVNPNGEPIKATFFVSLDAKVDYGAVNKLYAAGHEIAIHTMTHTTSTNTSLATFRQEIVGCRRALSRYAAIPEPDLVGFRAPYLKFNDNAFQVLGERGLRYDSSLQEWPGSYSTNAGQYLWPYTLEGGVVQSNRTGAFPIQPVPGLFEIPLWNQVTSGVSAVSMDPPDTMDSNAVTALWKTNFLSHYEGNRAPYGLFLHTTTTNQWLSNPNYPWRSDVLNEFIGWAQTYSNVWFVTMRDVTDFITEPVSVDQASTAAVFRTTTRTPALVTFCRNVGLNVCGDCPPARPWPTSVYCEAGPITGGVLTLAVTTNSSWMQYRLVYTNDTGEAAMDWEAVFEFPTNYVFGSAQASSAYMETNGAVIRMTLWPKDYRLPLVAGATETNVNFSIQGLASTNVQLISSSLSGLRPIHPVILGFAEEADGGFRVAWNDSAYGYSAEVSTNLMVDSWQPLTNLYGPTNWVWIPSASATSEFFRVRGIP